MTQKPKSAAEEMLAQQRVLRDRARAGFVARVERLRSEMAPDALAGRLIDDVTYKTRGVVVQAIEIASDNRGIVAGTAAALALWLARRPLGKGLSNLGKRIGRGRKTSAATQSTDKEPQP